METLQAYFKEALLPSMQPLYGASVFWLAGSHLYHLNTMLSDFDLVYVYFDSVAHVMPLPNEKERPSQISWKYDNGEFITSGEDNKLVSLARFAELLTKGNPNMVELLYYPYASPAENERWDDHVLMTNFLRDIRPYTATRKLLAQYLGHVRGVVIEIEKGKLPAGKEMKRIAHARRLQIAHEYLATNGEVRVFRNSDADVERLRQIRTSKDPYVMDREINTLIANHAQNEESFDAAAKKLKSTDELIEKINKQFVGMYCFNS